jgi:uncharacterized protein (TIGR03067 family)
MRLFLFAVVAAILSATIAPLRAGDTKKDQEGLQGTWQVVELTFNGMSVPEDARKEIKLTFKGERVQIGKRGHSFKLDPTKKPKAIDLTLLDEPNQGKTISAIYELKGDDLTLCIPFKLNADRPMAFKAEKGADLMLYVLRRSK